MGDNKATTKVRLHLPNEWHKLAKLYAVKEGRTLHSALVQWITEGLSQPGGAGAGTSNATEDLGNA